MSTGGRFQKGERRSAATEFRSGAHASPATEIQAGQRLSPRTEFKRGQAAHNALPLGYVTLRYGRSDRAERAWVKVAQPSKWKLRAVVVWEAANGPLPRGMVVHHRDRNPLNDDLANLQALTRSEHADEHRGELNEAKRAAPFHGGRGRRPSP